MVKTRLSAKGEVVEVGRRVTMELKPKSKDADHWCVASLFWRVLHRATPVIVTFTLTLCCVPVWQRQLLRRRV